MRPPRVHFSMRLMMIAVACCAVFLAGGVWLLRLRTESRARLYREKALQLRRNGEQHRIKAAEWQYHLMLAEIALDQEREQARSEWAKKRLQRREDMVKGLQSLVQNEDGLANSYNEFGEKYEQAAEDPLVSILPEPPQVNP
jgi:hypothetical protein